MLRYEVLGEDGPWVSLLPGGRRELEVVRPLAQLVADKGFRVLVHDRRNCGASDVIIDGDDAEHQIWADDLHELLTQLDATPAWVGGGSSGCRVAMTYAMRYLEDTKGMLLWRVTGGEFAAKRLARQYYFDYLEALEEGGMEAVCETEHFAARIAARPENRDRLMSMDPNRFVEVMTNWSKHFLEGADLPVIGLTEEDLSTLNVPACIIPGNDNTHSRVNGEIAHQLLPDSELHVLFPDHQDVDLVPSEDWGPREPEIADLFVDFMQRRG